MKLLIKLGGTLLDAADSRERLAREINEVAQREQVVVVHGGGKQMTRFLAERGIESRFINGLRVTTPDVVDAVVKVFAGSVNAQLVSSVSRSRRATGRTQRDQRGFGRCGSTQSRIGTSGETRRLRREKLLEILVREGYLPGGRLRCGRPQGNIYNVNGDQMAVACAQGFNADKLIFLTDVEGVRDASGITRAVLTRTDALKLIADGVATGGMQAKIEAALTALGQKVGEVIIAPGALPDVVDQILRQSLIGTRLVLE